MRQNTLRYTVNLLQKSSTSQRPTRIPPATQYLLSRGFTNKNTKMTSFTTEPTPSTIPPTDPKHPKSDEGWMNRPPYRTTDTNEQFEKKYTAHCHCGRVKYWLSRDRPLSSKFCHCRDCQALHGAPFQWAAIFHKEDLHFENGAEGLAFYHSGDKNTHYKLPIKVSCAFCHAPIMDEGRNMVLMFPAIIKFGDPEHQKYFEPECHIFYGSRVVDLPDGKPKWTGLDKASSLMKEVDKEDMQTVVGKREVEPIN